MFKDDLAEGDYILCVLKQLRPACDCLRTVHLDKNKKAQPSCGGCARHWGARLGDKPAGLQGSGGPSSPLLCHFWLCQLSERHGSSVRF